VSAPDPGEEACGCTIPSRAPMPVAFWLAALGAVVLVLRRR
jgi:hypothetical protein